jgi:hypothetical protein
MAVGNIWVIEKALTKKKCEGDGVSHNLWRRAEERKGRRKKSSVSRLLVATVLQVRDH